MSQAGRGSERANGTSSDGITSWDCSLILLQRFAVNGSGGYACGVARGITTTTILIWNHYGFWLDDDLLGEQEPGKAAG